MSAFEELKKCLTTAPLLSPPIGGGRYILDTDASEEALGVILQQEQNGSGQGNRLCKSCSTASREAVLYKLSGRDGKCLCDAVTYALVSDEVQDVDKDDEEFPSAGKVKRQYQDLGLVSHKSAGEI